MGEATQSPPLRLFMTFQRSGHCDGSFIQGATQRDALVNYIQLSGMGTFQRDGTIVDADGNVFPSIIQCIESNSKDGDYDDDLHLNPGI